MKKTITTRHVTLKLTHSEWKMLQHVWGEGAMAYHDNIGFGSSGFTKRQDNRFLRMDEDLGS